MPPSDQEPRYRLVDSNGNVVGSIWGDGNGNVKIADETDTQTTFGTDGISTPALEANALGHGIEDFTDEVANRSLNTVYQNTSDFNLIVAVQIRNETGGTTGINVDIQVGNTSNSLTIIDQYVEDLKDTGRKILGPVIVPPGGYYEARSFENGSLEAYQEALTQ